MARLITSSDSGSGRACRNLEAKSTTGNRGSPIKGSSATILHGHISNVACVLGSSRLMSTKSARIAYALSKCNLRNVVTIDTTLSALSKIARVLVC